MICEDLRCTLVPMTTLNCRYLLVIRQGWWPLRLQMFRVPYPEGRRVGKKDWTMRTKAMAGGHAGPSGDSGETSSGSSVVKAMTSTRSLT
ncbi:hypothetical protein CB1_001033040 [Camelus ferus]|nr:hypothetical protein CB1_001033040 [Camelus ferus]